MGFDFNNFPANTIEESFVEWLVADHWFDLQRHFVRLWEYYHNPIIMDGPSLNGGGGSETGRYYHQAQECGLPRRITGYSGSGQNASFAGEYGNVQRKEVVIENDITWRINAMVDFLFGNGVDFISKALDASKRREIEQIIKTVFDANGAAGFFQDMAVLGSVYGFVDCVLRPSEEVFEVTNQSATAKSKDKTTTSFSSSTSFSSVLQKASKIGLELIEAPRALPILNEDDYRKIEYYVQNFYQQKNMLASGNSGYKFLKRQGHRANEREVRLVTEVLGAEKWQRYENQELVSEGVNPLGVVPMVHVQNLAQPYYYEGISDVEQLVGLQDELNTRLSDRASRITFQAFKMYLAKGLEGIEDKKVSPGMIWCTDNPDASIEQFGGDGGMPSENQHITEIREAMDKISGVTPVVAGVLKNKLGNLTSGVALKMTFMGMLKKTNRKQFTYGQGLKEIVRMVLHTLDVCGVYRSDPSERDVEVVFSNPLPEDVNETIKQAQMKIELGIPREQVLREIGY